MLYDENLPQMDAHLLAVEYLPGQYDQRADSAAQCLQLLSPDQARPKVVCAKVYALEGEGVTREMMDAIAHHVINPVEARRASMEKPETLEMQADAPADVAFVEGFTRMDDKVLSDMVARMGMAMSAEDLCFCRDYFRDTEKRDPQRDGTSRHRYLLVGSLRPYDVPHRDRRHCVRRWQIRRAG